MINCCERVDLLALLRVVFSCMFVTFLYSVPGQVWNLVYLLDFFCSSIEFYLLLSPYICFISFLYLDLYVLGEGH